MSQNETPLIKNLTAFQPERNTAVVSWESMTDDWYKFRIFRGSEVGEFEQIGEVYKTEQFIDRSVPITSLNKSLTYKLVPDGVQDEYKTILGLPFKDLLAMEMSRRNRIKLQGWGRPAALFSIKTLAKRCDCYDPTINRRTKQNCPDCKNTGRKGGYCDPVLIHVATTAKTDDVRLSDLGESEKGSSSFWTSGDIIIKPRDVIVTAGQTRFRVVDVTKNNLRHTITKQTMTMADINANDIEYDLKLTDSLMNEIMTMPRLARMYQA